MLLDAIRFAETGHLSPLNAQTAVSPKGAQGPYQFLQRNLHNMGYGMPRDIQLADVQDPTKARQLAGQYVSGYSGYHNFTTPLDKLVAYNMGPQATVEWKARGGRIEDLPSETQQYIQRAAKFLTSAPTDEGNTMMAQTAEYRPGVTIKQDLQMGPPYKYPENEANARNATRMAEAQSPSAMINMALNNASVADRRPDALDDQPAGQTGNQGMLAQVASALNPISSANAATSNDGYVEPVLTQDNAQQKSVGPGLPILTNYTPLTSRRRDQSNMALPSTQIDTNEMLMRVGLAGAGASQQGGLAALQQMGQTYGQIMDANRANGLAAYQAAMEGQANDQAAMAEAQGEIAKYDATLDNFEKAAGFMKEGGLTGVFQGTVGKLWDRSFGDPDKANKRLLLERLRVDDLLIRIAQTKGAISNKEMEIFARPAPEMSDDDPIWERWINDRIEAIRTVRNNLARINGLQERGTYNPTSNFQPTQQQVDLVGKYIN